jgi:lipopolysaccharide heptosyltransferase I
LKILILKPSSLGDVIHAIPVLRLLKRHWPQSDIHWWLETSLVPLLEGDPDLAGIYPFNRKDWAAASTWLDMLRVLGSMRREKFDLAMDLQGLARSGIVSWLANAETCLGMDNTRGGSREGAGMFYDQLAPGTPPGTHAVNRYLSILKPLGVPAHFNFDWLPPRPKVAAALRDKWQPQNTAQWVALLPGARWNSKRWPVECFAELVRILGPRQPEARFVVLGGKSDAPLGRAIADAHPERVLDLTGNTALPEVIEWIRLTRLVITNDTGPMHIAAALQKPVVAIFGPTNPDSTGPFGQRQNVLQSASPECIPCLKSECGWRDPLACMRAVTPAQVAERAMKLMATAG